MLSCRIAFGLALRDSEDRGLSAGSRAAVAAVGAAILVVGLFTLAFSLWFPASLSKALSQSAVEAPLVPGCLSLLGLAILFLALGWGGKWSPWVVRVLTASVMGICALPWLSPGSQFVGAMVLTQQSSAIVFNCGASLLAGSLCVFLATLSRPLSIGTSAIVLALSVGALGLFVGESASVEGVGTVSLGILGPIVAAYSAFVVLLSCTSPAGRAAVWMAGFSPVVPLLAAIAVFLTGVSPSLAWVAGSVVFVGIGLIAISIELKKRQEMATEYEAIARQRVQAQSEFERLGGVGTWKLEPTTGRVTLSDQASSILGTSIESLDEFVSLFPEDRRTEIKSWFDVASRSNEPHQLTVCCTVNGSARWIELRERRVFVDGNGDEVWGTLRNVTETHNQLSETCRSLEFMRRVASKVPDIDFVYDLRSDEYIYASRPVGVLIGRHDDTSGTIMEDSVVAEDAEAFFAHVQRVNRSKDDAVHEVDVRANHVQGNEVWIRCRSSVFERDETGSPTSVFGTYQDVTEDRKVRQQLKEAEARYAAVSARCPGAIFQYKLGANQAPSFPYFSPSLPVLLGVTEDALTSDPVQSFTRVWSEDRESLLEKTESSRLHLHDIEWTGRIEQPDGRTSWLQISSRPMRLEDGSTLWDGVAVDVTTTREALAQLQDVRTRLDAVLLESNAVHYVCLASSPYPISEVSSNVRFVLGYIPEQIVGQSLFGTSFVHIDDLETVQQHGRRFTDHGESRAEYRIRALSGDYVWIRDDVRIVSNGRGELEVVGSWTDVSEQRAAWTRLQEQTVRYQVLASQSPGMTVELTLHDDGKPEFLFVSQGSFRLVGVAPEDIRQRPETFLRLIESEDRTRLYRDLLRSQSDMEDIDWSGTVLLQDVEKEVRFHARPISERSGSVLWIGCFDSVSESRPSEKQSATQVSIDPEEHAVEEGNRTVSVGIELERAQTEPEKQAKSRKSVLLIASQEEAVRLSTEPLVIAPEVSITIATSTGLGLELAKRNRPDGVVVFEGLDTRPSWIVEAIRSDDDLMRVPVIVLGVDPSSPTGLQLARMGARAVQSPIEDDDTLAEAIRTAIESQ